MLVSNPLAQSLQTYCFLLFTTLRISCDGYPPELPPNPAKSRPSTGRAGSPTGPAESAESSKCSVPNTHHWKSECREDINLTKSVRNHRESGDLRLQDWSIGNSRGGAFSLLVACLRSHHFARSILTPLWRLGMLILVGNG
jgi:hypothetical protein